MQLLGDKMKKRIMTTTKDELISLIKMYPDKSINQILSDYSDGVITSIEDVRFWDGMELKGETAEKVKDLIRKSSN
jgi:hypothetical protein